MAVGLRRSNGRGAGRCRRAPGQGAATIGTGRIIREAEVAKPAVGQAKRLPALRTHKRASALVALYAGCYGRRLPLAGVLIIAEHIRSSLARDQGEAQVRPEITISSPPEGVRRPPPTRRQCRAGGRVQLPHRSADAPRGPCAGRGRHRLWAGRTALSGPQDQLVAVDCSCLLEGLQV